MRYNGIQTRFTWFSLQSLHQFLKKYYEKLNAEMEKHSESIQQNHRERKTSIIREMDDTKKTVPCFFVGTRSDTMKAKMPDDAEIVVLCVCYVS